MDDEYDTRPDELPGTASRRRDRLVHDIAAAIRHQLTEDALTDEEQRWVRLAIEKQNQSIKFREAVITKTFAGLAWAGVVALGYLVLDYLKTHFGFKP
jgi:hypothetical protein